MRYCAFEPGDFPESQFDYMPPAGYVHRVKPWHTDEGQMLHAIGEPGAPAGPVIEVPAAIIAHLENVGEAEGEAGTLAGA